MQTHLPRRLARTLLLMLCTMCLGSCTRTGTESGPMSDDKTLAFAEVVTLEDPDAPPRPEVPGGEPVATVYLFIAPDCPISNAYAPEIGRLVDAYTPRGVAFLAVHADPRVSDETARRHAQEFKLRCPVLLDPKQELAKPAGVTVTPEAAVFDAKGNRVYLGRIDDLFYSFGKRRAAPTTRELRDALDAVLEGRPVAQATVPALGCEIPPL